MKKNLDKNRKNKFLDFFENFRFFQLKIKIFSFKLKNQFKRENFDFQLKNFRFFSKFSFFNFFFSKCSNFFFRWTQKKFWGSISILQITYFRFLALSERFGHSEKSDCKKTSHPPLMTEPQITVFI